VRTNGPVAIEFAGLALGELLVDVDCGAGDDGPERVITAATTAATAMIMAAKIVAAVIVIPSSCLFMVSASPLSRSHRLVPTRCLQVLCTGLRPAELLDDAIVEAGSAVAEVCRRSSVGFHSRLW
jgi:hypothetical protein